MKNNFLLEMQQRGFVNQCTDIEKLAPPIIKLKRGKNINNPIEIKNTGICFPSLSLFFFE